MNQSFLRHGQSGLPWSNYFYPVDKVKCLYTNKAVLIHAHIHTHVHMHTRCMRVFQGAPSPLLATLNH